MINKLWSWCCDCFFVWQIKQEYSLIKVSVESRNERLNGAKLIVNKRFDFRE
jgi:hypothetical protein